ncbi:MAG: hypothetical protein IJA07_06820 [Agathobacter sp.]|nr:hypothetical protein [Agathobacter sp.]
MKRLTLEATDENVLESIKNNTLYRNDDVKEFVVALDSIEGNMFISLDANWGEGKTFFVRQIQKTLEYVTKRDWDEGGKEDVEKLETFFKGTSLNKVVLDKSYFPVYYNAWLYDNHDDPLLSLVLTLVKETEGYFNTKLNSAIGEKVTELIKGFSISIGNIQVSPTPETDILNSVKTAEQIREMVKSILDNVINEKAQRLVIFLDELDRCRPSFAIEMLERIKHYFDDERILFVVSVNKGQLVHTISKCYGYGFDSSAYLNKFFDVNAHMPIFSSKDKNSLFEVYNSDKVHFMKISEGLNTYYKLSLRDSLIFKQRIQNINSGYIHDIDAQGCVLSLFVPIILMLDIVNQDEKKKFLDGQSKLLGTLVTQIPAVADMVCRFGNIRDGREQAIVEGIAKIEATYLYIFKSLRDQPKHCLDVSYDLKRQCLQICNSVKKEGE